MEAWKPKQLLLGHSDYARELGDSYSIVEYTVKRRYIEIENYEGVINEVDKIIYNMGVTANNSKHGVIHWWNTLRAKVYPRGAVH